MTRSRASSRASTTMSVLDEDPHGCCAKCCLKFPWPSIIAFILIIIGAFSFLAAVHIGGNRTKQYFSSTDLSEQLNKWIDSITITVYCVVGFMFVIAIMLLGVSYLSTGSTRSSYICRFKTRKSGRCQTNLFLGITYFLYLCWLVVTCLAMVPLLFFHAMKKGLCKSTFEGSDCLDLRQWALLPYDNNDVDSNICGQDLEDICEDSKLRYLFFLVFASSLLILVSLVQFLINTTANHSQIRDRYKRSHVSRTAGSYNFRTTERESLSASQRRIKKHTGRSNMPVKTALHESQSLHGGSVHESLHDSNPWIETPPRYTRTDPGSDSNSFHGSQELSSISALQQPASSREPVYYHEYQI